MKTPLILAFALLGIASSALAQTPQGEIKGTAFMHTTESLAGTLQIGS